ncbi:MAG: hypothetical protein EZS28_036933 [Streblomastix strix]|uniref:Uncharacterized protein n=1 Tax=Streblomastix strix TaxID=222440 RepID=A0A5J4UBE7_9EUKA|nr:MAG: hypothetical protein EZS28_036933 [Streblomastix strix]
MKPPNTFIEVKRTALHSKRNDVPKNYALSYTIALQTILIETTLVKDIRGVRKDGVTFHMTIYPKYIANTNKIRYINISLGMNSDITKIAGLSSFLVAGATVTETGFQLDPTQSHLMQQLMIHI